MTERGRGSVVAAVVAASAVVLAVAGCSSGGSPLDAGATSGGGHGFGLGAGQRLVVVTDGGVALHAGSGTRVVVGEPAGAVVERWQPGSGQAELDLRCPAHPAAGRPCPQVVDVTVPQAAAVTVQARNAGVSAVGLSGPLNLATVNGDVTLTTTPQGAEPVQLTTRNGSVRATGLRAASLAAHTVNGDVDLAWSTAPGSVTADTTNGSVDVALPTGHPAYALTAVTRNGQPHLAFPTTPGTRDRIDLTTVNGDVTVRAGAGS